MPEDNNPTPTTENTTPGSIDGIKSGNLNYLDLVQAQPAQNPPAPAQTANTQKPEANDQKPKPEKNKQPKKKSNWLAITTAIIILLALSTVAIASKLQSSSNSDETAIQQNSAEAAEASPSDAGQIIKQIDQLPNDQDQSGDSLTDSQLGF